MSCPGEGMRTVVSWALISDMSNRLNRCAAEKSQASAIDVVTELFSAAHSFAQGAQVLHHSAGAGSDGSNDSTIVRRPSGSVQCVSEESSENLAVHLRSLRDLLKPFQSPDPSLGSCTWQAPVSADFLVAPRPERVSPLHPSES